MALVHKIITFGCWNNLPKYGTINDEDNYVNSKPDSSQNPNSIPYICVVNEIKRLDYDSNSSLIILGDNYYPKKTKDDNGIKRVNYKKEELIYGFNAINSINIQNKYLIMGIMI